MNEEVKYYYKDASGQTQGAYSLEELKRLKLGQHTLVWYRGLSDWAELSSILSPSTPNHYKWILLGFLSVIAFGGISALIYGMSIQNCLTRDSRASDEFNMYVEKYYRDLEYFGISVVKPSKTSVRFAPMQYFEDTKDIYGLSCGYNNDDIIEIYINEDRWKKLTRAQKYLIMYHELSHDILNVNDLPDLSINENKLMCPVFDRYKGLSMDDFIEISHDFFIEYQQSK